MYFLQDGFVVRIFATSTEPVLQQELQLKLARKCLHACGISLFDLEKDLHIISKFSSLKVNNKPDNSNSRAETLCFPLALLCAGRYNSIINTWRGVWNHTSITWLRVKSIHPFGATFLSLVLFMVFSIFLQLYNKYIIVWSLYFIIRCRTPCCGSKSTI